MKHDSAPITHYRSDYQPPDFLVEKVHLLFQLDPNKTRVTSRLMVRRNPKSQDSSAALFLHGEQLRLIEAKVNDCPLSSEQFEVTSEGLRILQPMDQFELATVVEIDPANNGALEGLYVSGDKFCTQCEAEGFRRITYYLDRPDVLSEYHVRIEADKKRYPLLLSNGNKTAAGELANNQHYVEWHDPFLKPSYLFALVAGDLDQLSDTFTTMSGREIALELYVDKGKLDQSKFAMESLKNSMRWDEQRYGLEYDLDLYMIVAVGDFNMGAMENKGLNIFNTKYVLANSATATDQDFENIESVIGHEYFHNWTGNRVTCRDWFQLSLKEGLTVFRDQQFTEDMRSKAVKRIDDVKVIRSFQFAEDAGPMAHPIRPDSYIEMNNFYTVTVYNKGAEVIRMLHSILGEDGFQKGMQLYFKRHDGSAATCDDFVAAMSDANDCDLSAFKHWYSQAGTPTLTASFKYEADNAVMIINFKQSNSHESAANPYWIPIKIGLVGDDGSEVMFSLSENEDTQTTEFLYRFASESAEIKLYNVQQSAIPSLLRDFTAPVKLQVDYTDAQLAHLFANDVNTFNRWDAGQRLLARFLLHDVTDVKPQIVEAFAALLADETIDNAFKARCLTLPDYKTLFESDYSGGIDDLIARRRELKSLLSEALKKQWQTLYQTLHVVSDEALDSSAIGARALKNTALDYWSGCSDFNSQVVTEQWQKANLMTDELAALSIANHHQLPCADTITQAFYDKWQHEPLVMDKWLATQASVDAEVTVKKITELRHDRVFNIKNPNKVRSLFAAFAANNFPQFHRIDGAGYRLVAEAIIEIDEFNNQVAANLAKQFAVTSKLDETRQLQVKPLLRKILDKKNLSKDVFEVVSKTLESIESR
ncbi:MAG: aminopeptidase N [Gammaproteobacteria bacterium]|nr:aminopeptidase N [Gammaproteobacteria bacterium]